MTITPLLSAGQPAAATGSTPSIAKDFNRFLQLLTTQLRNQDPLSPMDANQFTSQLVQFSQVEQSIGMNQNLAKLVSAQESSQLRDDIVTGQSFVGRTVDALSESIPLRDGEADLIYAVGQDAATVNLEVLNDLGEVVAVLPGRPGTGLQRLEWDGEDLNGNRLDDGTYGLRVVARDAEGEAVAGQAGFTASVSELTGENGSVALVAGGLAVPIGAVVAVRSNTSDD